MIIILMNRLKKAFIICVEPLNKSFVYLFLTYPNDHIVETNVEYVIRCVSLLYYYCIVIHQTETTIISMPCTSHVIYVDFYEYSTKQMKRVLVVVLLSFFVFPLLIYIYIPPCLFETYYLVDFFLYLSFINAFETFFDMCFCVAILNCLNSFVRSYQCLINVLHCRVHSSLILNYICLEMILFLISLFVLDVFIPNGES